MIRLPRCELRWTGIYFRDAFPPCSSLNQTIQVRFFWHVSDTSAPILRLVRVVTQSYGIPSTDFHVSCVDLFSGIGRTVSYNDMCHCVNSYCTAPEIAADKVDISIIVLTPVSRYSRFTIGALIFRLGFHGIGFPSSGSTTPQESFFPRYYSR